MPGKQKIKNLEAQAGSVVVNEANFNEPVKLKPRYTSREKILYVILGVLAVVGLIFAGWSYKEYRENQMVSKELALVRRDKPASAGSDVSQLIAQVGSLMVLPQNEQPTVATVTDLDKLQGQPFFANAQVGDKVLIYSQAGKAILYRPGENKIIELAPLNTPEPSSAGQNLLTLEIRNGSGKTGAAKNLKIQLEQDPEFSVVGTGNAKTIYPRTIIYVAGGQLPSFAARLQQIASATVVSVLPAGEPTSSEEALVIIGRQ
jgi:LytR cell envelope-related transcriptional attenuator